MKKHLLLIVCFFLAAYPIRAVDCEERHLSEMTNLINESFQKFGVSEDYKAQFIANIQKPLIPKEINNNNQTKRCDASLIRQQTMCIASFGNTKSQINFNGNLFIDLFEISLKNK